MRFNLGKYVNLFLGLRPFAGCGIWSPEACIFTLQNGCEFDLSEHLQLAYSPRAIAYTLRGLGANVPILCVPRTPL